MIENDLGWIGRHLAFSFANLMELRFIAFFEDANVKLREIREIMDEVRLELKRPHPFSTNIVFQTDGSKIIARIAKKNGVDDIYDLKSRNFEMREIVFKSLRDDVVYDPAGDARLWFPRKGIAPNVIVHPRLAFGHPVIKGSWVPTEAIAASVEAEGSTRKAALVWDIPVSRVEEAVRFESALRRAA